MAEVQAKAPTLTPSVTTKTTNAVANAKKQTFSSFIKSDAVQHSLATTLGDSARTKTFTASVVTAVSTNPELAKCEPMSIISAALLGETLKLSPSPQLAQFYMLPFNDTKTGTTKANFILSWRGMYQLALRSGQYRAIEAVAVKEGELKSYNPITGEIELEPITDPLAREKAKTVGYYAFFELLNGFKKQMYWSKEKMQNHAMTYSKGYASDVKNGRAWTFWSKDFDSMSLKTMLRQLIGKYGVMSIEMQKAWSADEQTNTIDEETGEIIQEVQFDTTGAVDAEFSESN